MKRTHKRIIHHAYKPEQFRCIILPLEKIHQRFWIQRDITQLQTWKWQKLRQMDICRSSDAALHVHEQHASTYFLPCGVCVADALVRSRLSVRGQNSGSASLSGCSNVHVDSGTGSCLWCSHKSCRLGSWYCLPSIRPYLRQVQPTVRLSQVQILVCMRQW